MPIQTKEIKKLLVVHLGQVGDVVMSFPALIAIRKRFSSAEIVVIAGKTPASLVGDLGLADGVIAIDRYGLLAGPKIRSISKILGTVRQVRKEHFDLVIDLHSLHESNLLGFLSGAKYRLFANRRNRSIDRLSNVRPRPPVYDPTKHLSKLYLDVIRPLGITDVDFDVRVSPPPELVQRFRHRYFESDGQKFKNIGLAIGAGHPSRKWGLQNFVDIGRRFREFADNRVFVFLGPEEKLDESRIRAQFAGIATVVANLSLIELAAAYSSLDFFIGNDTGTTHLAAVSGPQTIMISDSRAPDTFRPIGYSSKTVRTDLIERITVDDVWRSVDLFHERTHEDEQPKEYQANERQEH